MIRANRLHGSWSAVRTTVRNCGPTFFPRQEVGISSCAKKPAAPARVERPEPPVSGGLGDDVEGRLSPGQQIVFLAGREQFAHVVRELIQIPVFFIVGVKDGGQRRFCRAA